ncbi:MAG: methyltransferase domain-containing protein [SAR202 cluster bacterium]|jgi:ubiquinone/menaquinone biosynthesis C-methylase UbiE|nr:methyltransferase domain-containing protein [SAR202 cluster bacterium]
MDIKQFKNFFKPYAKTVDSVNETSAFWRLSDAIIMEIIQKEIIPFCNQKTTILDAGGGTARWAINISKNTISKIIVFDKSEDMLAKAEENLEKANVTEKITLIQGDMINMSSIKNESIDHVVSIYSPLSFIYEQDKAMKELYRITKKGSRILIMAHGYYNALFSKINNYKATITELEKLENTNRVTWAPHVPELVTHSKETIEKLFVNTGFTPLKTFGIPVLVQPGVEDFDPDNKKVSEISKYLENTNIFNNILKLEMRYNSMSTISNRGMSIFALAIK